MRGVDSFSRPRILPNSKPEALIWLRSVFTFRSISRSGFAATAYSTPTGIISTITRTPRSAARSPSKCYLPGQPRCCWTPSACTRADSASPTPSPASALEQFQQYAPEVMESFHELNDTGCVEFLDETYYHSLAFLYSREEFRAQVEHAPAVDQATVRPGAARLPQYRTDLQQRSGPFRQPHGIRRDPHRRGRSYPGLSQPQFRLSPAARAAN